MLKNLARGLLICLTPVAFGCGSGEVKSDGNDGAPSEAIAALRANASEVAARPEHDADRVTVQHILIAFAGSNRSTQTRSKEEAEALAAELFQKANSGEDFATLMRNHSNDPGPGEYGMSGRSGKPGDFPRANMALAFGDVGWRLEVGEIGVAAYDPVRSGFGWHLIKRVE